MKKHTIMKKTQTKDFRKDSNVSFFIILGFCILQLLLAFGGDFLGWTSHNEFFGSMYLTFCIIAITSIYIMNKDYVLDNQIQKEKMTPIKLLKYFSTMITFMILFTIPVVVIDMILKNFGLTLMSVSPANEFSDSVTDFLYVAIVGPICEEIIFRGMLQKKLEKYSPVIAIIVSALAFGIYHGNFGQIFPMVGTGLILGYVAYKYGLKWSIVIHVFYNTVIGELFGLLSDALEKNGEEFVLPLINQTPFAFTIMLLTFIGVFFIAKHIIKGQIPFSDYRIKIRKILNVFTSVGFILFFLYNIGTAILLIEKVV